jgi:hypothetical protein
LLDKLTRELETKTAPRAAMPSTHSTAPFDSGLGAFLGDKTLVSCQLHRGQFDHYFHFLFGLFVPLVDFLDDQAIQVAIRDCGPMSRIIHEYADPRIHILPAPLFETAMENPEISSRAVKLVGHDAVETYDSSAFERVKIRVHQRLQRMMPFFGYKYDQQVIDKGYCLVIDRAPALPYYESAQSAYNLSGTQRRSVTNLFEIYQHLEASQPTIYAVLELLSFWEQVYLFRNAKTIIAQHGASLGNIIWSEKPSHAVEIGTPGDPDLFQKLAALGSCRYQKYVVDSNHISLPIAKFISFLNGA